MKIGLVALHISLAIAGCCKLATEDIRGINEQAMAGSALVKQCQQGHSAACTQAAANFDTIGERTTAALK
jgi:hypothetical protein